MDVETEFILLVAVGVLVLVAATGVSRRIGVAAPLLLVAIGAGLSYVPGAPVIHLEAEWILLIVLPPLLYGAAVAFPVIDFRRNLPSIAFLGVALVIISAVAVGWVLFVVFPDLDLASAIALGAVLSPTDAVSATSIAKRIGLPSRIVTVLEGESLVNDASALVLLRTATASIAAAFNLPAAIGSFFWATFAAIVVGAVVGALSVFVRSRFKDPVMVTSLSFVIPFFAYAPAEAMNASGVIAVVTAGLIVGHYSVRSQTIQLRFAEQTNWRTVQFILENGVFLLMGYQLREYIDDDIHDGFQPGYTIAIGLLAVGVLVVVRLAFTYPLFGLLARRSRRIAAGRHSLWALLTVQLRRRVAVLRRRDRDIDWHRQLQRRHESDRAFHAREALGWRSSTIIGWSGMRGVVTVAAVQSLPADTPYRSALILIAFTAATVTLLLGGLTLPGLARLLGVTEAETTTGADIRALFAELARTGRKVLANPKLAQADGTPFSPEALAQVHSEVARQAQVAERSMPSTPGGKQSAELQELRRQVFAAEREALADARATSTFGSAALDTAEAILNTIEAQTPTEG
ncbi:sodium:proton antiporter [Gryllotalpicola koreensis]|uniref:Sodium:proton antiporter n=1 Tax=Gryllotalpicola koreensis TaxID=993086 RepID=A0ABP8A144_9MICO